MSSTYFIFFSVGWFHCTQQKLIMQNLNEYMITVHFWNKLFLNVSSSGAQLKTVQRQWAETEHENADGEFQIMTVWPSLKLNSEQQLPHSFQCNFTKRRPSSRNKEYPGSTFVTTHMAISSSNPLLTPSLLFHSEWNTLNPECTASFH